MNKVCKKCGVEKSIEQFSMNRAARDGHVNNCKACETARVAKWVKENPEKVKSWEQQNRTSNLRSVFPQDTPWKCRKCGIVKMIIDFTCNPRNKNNLRTVCKSCTSKMMAEKYEGNPEKQRAKTAKWRTDNPVRQREYEISYRTENRDALNERRRQFRLRHIDREKEKDKLYLENNRAKVYAKNARRRAAQTQATPSWLTFIHKAQVDEFYELALAKAVQTGVPHDVDHIVPLRGKHVRGLHVPWNLQILTEVENSKKYNKFIERSA